MHNVLLLIPNLHFGLPVKQSALLARALRKRGYPTCVAVIGPDGPARHEFADCRLEVLNWSRVVDVRPLWRLRRLMHDLRPAVIHAWTPAALASARCATLGRSNRFVLSDPFRDWTAVDAYVVRGADRLILNSKSDVAAAKNLGMDDRAIFIPPGLEPYQPRQPGKLPCDLPAHARLVACVGRLEAAKGFHDAIWAFDIVSHLYADLHLVIVGEGPERSRLGDFAGGIGARERVHFIGYQREVGTILARSEIVWIPSRAETGTLVALEALALSRPLIATRLGGLRDIILDGQTGLLFEPGDNVALAKLTRRLLDDANLRRRLGEAGCQRVRESFPADVYVQRCLDAYSSDTAVGQ